MAEIEPPLPFDIYDDIPIISLPPVRPLSRVVFSTGKGDWGTPPDLFLKLHEEFNFTTDLAANAANTLLPCWLGPDHPDPARQDALTTEWSTLGEGEPGGVRGWLNPPYGRGVGAWVKKAYEEKDKGVLTAMLLPSRTDTAWFHDYVVHCDIRFLRRRLRFQGAPAAAPFPSMLVIFRPIEDFGWFTVTA